jgi:hypothetical protein
MREDWTMQRNAVLVTLLFIFVAPLVLGADDAPKDTPSAAKTREKLKKKIDVDWKNTMFKEIIDDLKDMTGVNFIIDTKSGVSQNTKFTYKAKGKPADEVLTAVLADRKWGWFVISKEKDAYDGAVKVRVAEVLETGYEKIGSGSGSSK